MKTYHIILIIILLCFVPLFGFLTPDFPLTHDGQDHIARIANFYQNLSEGVIIPRWGGNLNWGYGHPILMFLYPLPSYFGSLFHLVGFSFITSTKLVFITSYILSGIAMYIWVKEILGKYPGIVAAVLYIFAPYRFVDLYIRGAIGEHVAFIFPPLILYFLNRIRKENPYINFIGAVLSMAGLILSHNAISLMFIPIIILYSIYIVQQSKDKKQLFISIVLVFLLGFGMSAFFWVPALFEGKYTLRDIVTSKDYSTRFVQIKDFFFSSWNYGGSQVLSKQVGIVHWIIILIGSLITILDYYKNKKINILLTTSIAIFLASLLIMTKYSQVIWDTFSILQKFQFPWRFLSVTVFISAFIGGLVTSYVPKGSKMLFSLIVIASLLFFNSGYWHAEGYLNKPETFYTSTYNSTTDTGESSPIWSVRFMEKRPKAPVEIIDGMAEVKNYKRSVTRRTYIVTAVVDSKIRENTLYFPGWSVYVDGKQVPIEFQDASSRGIITFLVGKGLHTVEVIFTETKLRLAANMLSIVSLLQMVIWSILLYKQVWRHFR